jgi:NhaP-type Na+/H+ or K+/H+ antiporter
MPTEMAIFFGLIVAYGAVSVLLGRFSITMPIIFVILGALLGSKAIFCSADAELLIEMTLALLLFADASTLAFRQVRDDPGPPARLLLIAMPLIVALGGLVAYGLFPGEGLGFALLLAAILAPTDAALGLPILNNPRVPVRIRRALNVESGLNDGIATPLVALFTALALAHETQRAGDWLLSALGEIGIGMGAGIAAGLLGGWLYAAAVKRGWTSATGEQIGNLALAMCAFWAAKAPGGQRLCRGLCGRHHVRPCDARTPARGDRVHRNRRHTPVALCLGGVRCQPGAPLVQSFQPLALLYAFLSLTAIRMVPVAISLIGSRLRPDTTLIMGWFGPRGLASVVFALIAYESFHEAGRSSDLLADTVAWTVLLSVVLHGISAVPLANWYERRLETEDRAAPELIKVPELGIWRKDPSSWLKHGRKVSS